MMGMYRLAVVRSGDRDTTVVEQDGRLLPVATLLGDTATLGALDDLAPLLQDWARWSNALDAAVATAGERFRSEGSPAADARFRPPLKAPGKLICIGANYHDHIAEMPIPIVPTYPYSFLKPASNTLRGSGEAVVAPAGVEMFDWEAELAVIIGTTCKDVSEADALSVIAGYANFNDFSARDWIASRPPIGVDWVRHKGYDGFAPFGPYLLPARFVADPQDLPVRLSVNGIVKQDSSTAQMVYGVAPIIAHLTSIMTLSPGDVIATGTPAGVGHGRKPPEYLKPGDEVRMEIGALGELVTPIIAP
ncbi:MAG TPA: fumarylacetoacetate hydrolase family protein [Sphingomonas sp.]|uniref:fumarylacetoacetate hydrolase family protein n=1 Tax=Sphingomonas sp. TaxID=28214 RepID=UPI002C658CB9|nr:fumarylacetoacetate hydrolase family protein [Sphingomonas sp.]HMI20611.1 fumarylacetoacetate hydrolase family protein [Sphingomonas sp.]